MSKTEVMDLGVDVQRMKAWRLDRWIDVLQGRVLLVPATELYTKKMPEASALKGMSVAHQVLTALTISSQDRASCPSQE